MVGVPGRSKSCITCRRRKKGCDKGVPFCGQCLTLGIQCEGYGRQLIWLNSNEKRQTAYSKPVDDCEPGTSASTATLELEAPPSSTIVLHESLTRTARNEKYTGLFWTDYLSGVQGLSLAASSTTKTQRVQMHNELSQTEATLGYIVMALSTATLAANNSDSQLRMKSLQAYGLAMQELAKSLAARGSNNDGILAAVQLMRVFEQLFGADPQTRSSDSPASQIQGFMRHIDGEAALILRRGPRDSWSALGRQLLADGRLNLINVSISRRRRSPFSQPEWKQSQLWTSDPDSSLNHLLDILVEVPALLEDLDIFRKALDGSEAELLRGALLERCRACEEALLVCSATMDQAIQKYDYTISGDPLPRPERDEELADVFVCCLYWMTCLFVYSTIGFCKQEIPGCEIQDLRQYQLAQRIATSYAYRIAHCIYLLFQPPAGDYSAVAALLPFGNAIRYLIMLETLENPITMSAERLMLRGIFKKPFFGSFVGRFLRNLQSDDGIDYGTQKLVGMEGVEFRARVWWCGLARAGEQVPLREDPCF